MAINGSPHSAIGNTSQMIRMIAEGLSREGIVLEEIFLTDKAVAYCIGCAVCLEISGAETFNAYLLIADNRCTFHEGSHEKPDVLIKAPAEVWLAVSQGTLDGQKAFLSGKYRVEGNVGLLLKLKTLFRA